MCGAHKSGSCQARAKKTIGSASSHDRRRRRCHRRAVHGDGGRAAQPHALFKQPERQDQGRPHEGHALREPLAARQGPGDRHGPRAASARPGVGHVRRRPERFQRAARRERLRTVRQARGHPLRQGEGRRHRAPRGQLRPAREAEARAQAGAAAAGQEAGGRERQRQLRRSKSLRLGAAAPAGPERAQQDPVPRGAARVLQQGDAERAVQAVPGLQGGAYGAGQEGTRVRGVRRRGAGRHRAARTLRLQAHADRRTQGVLRQEVGG